MGNRIYSLSQKDEVRLGIGHRASGIPHFFENRYIKDFIKDLKNCFSKRKAGAPINHFLGGILSVEYSVDGVVRQHKDEIIDGQQ